MAEAIINVHKMKTLLRFALAISLLLPLQLRAEGSKQLTPNKSQAQLTSFDNDKAGYLAHDANFSAGSGIAPTSLGFLKPYNFTRNGSTYSTDHRLYVRVKQGETLYYGVRRAVHDQTNASQRDLIITIRRITSTSGLQGAVVQTTTLKANTNSPKSMLLQNGQAGVINDATQADNGPNRPALGNYAAVANGYSPLQLTNNTGETQDYFIEFTQLNESNMTDDGQRFSVYDLWDFTVIADNGAEKPGRLYSKLWSFSAGGSENVFSKNFSMYPLIPSEQAGKYFVKKLELAGIAPQNFFRFVTNSLGTNVGTTVADRRKSQTTQSDYPEFNNFVNNPDTEFWPSAAAPQFSVSINTVCNPATSRGEVTFSGNSSESSTFIVLIDLNGTAGYQAGSRDRLLETSGPAGVKTITWDGLDGLGAAVAKGTEMNYYFKNGSGQLNFPVYDAEKNIDGFRVFDVRPGANNTASTLYWDDTRLSTARFPASSNLNLWGTVSTNGAHSWGANSTGGDLYTVNTWTYGFTNESSSKVAYTYDCSADIAVSQAVSGGPYYNGQAITYTVTVRNNGPITATNSAIQYTLPAGMTLVSTSPATGTYNSANNTWTIPSLANNASTTLTVVARPTTTGSFTTTATRTGGATADNNTVNNTASTTITVNPSADVAVTNTVPAGNYYVGNTVTYTVGVTNNGPNNLTNVSITDKLPAGVTFVSSSANSNYNVATGVWTIPTLNAGSTLNMTLTGTLVQTGIVSTTASLNTTSAYLDTNAANNSASNSINVQAQSDVQVTGSVSKTNPDLNELITYTFDVKNNGPSAATNVVLAGQIPSALTVVGISTTQGTFNNNSWAVGTIASGATQTITITARPNISNTTISLTGTQTHTEHDANAANNAATLTVNVKPSADIAVSNAVSAPQNGAYRIGDLVTYTVKVNNLGPDATTGQNVSYTLPAGLSYVSHTVSKGSYSTGSGLWSVGNMANAEQQTLTVVARITAAGALTTTAAKNGGSATDPVNGNNTAAVTINTAPADAPAQYSVNAAKHFYDYRNTETMATVADPDGAVVAARITAGSLPAGTVLQANGTITVSDFRYLRPGSNPLSITTTDAKGGVTTQSITLLILGDRDGDGVEDFADIDLNNDGITNRSASLGVEPLQDADNDGLLNYTDPDFVHPYYGAFRDLNKDGINDWFDLDMDGLINAYDIDMDNDGITNVIEANAGIVPADNIYDSLNGIIKGNVSANGMPVLAQTGNNNGISIFAQPDTDSDMLPDFLDLDSDNDGLTDLLEGQSTERYTLPANTDADRDGLDDAFDPSCGCAKNGYAIVPVGHDFDTIPDYLDLDSDGDYMTDFEEAADANTNGDYMEELKARGADYMAASGSNKYNPSNTNASGTPLWLEKNSNSIPLLMAPGSTYYFDTDKDGLIDLFDADNFGTPMQRILQPVSGQMSFREEQAINPLPVTLIKFTGKAGSNGAVLEWSTATEVNNDRFIVERSQDGKNFSFIGSVKGAGNSNHTLSYSMVDAKAPAGISYYRLKQVDFDGTYEYSKVVAVNMNQVLKGLPVKAILYPNPTNGITNLNMSTLPAGTYSITIISMEGRLVKQLELNSEVEQQLDLTNLSKGKYILRIQGREHQQNISVLKN